MIISKGIPAADRDAAAALYWDAFASKLDNVMGPRAKGLKFVRRVMRQDHAICAHAADGSLLGVVGFKTFHGALVGGTFRDLRAVYGPFGAIWRSVLLRALERDVENTRFLMDGLCVTPAARGKGVGTALLIAINDTARARGFQEVRLDVIDVNTRARALYERLGFVPLKTQHLGLLRHFFGFRSATTMVRQVTASFD